MRIVLATATLLVAVWLAHFWLHRTRNILDNLTTNERYNRRRYPHFRGPHGTFVNPFDKGAVRNCWVYFCDTSHQGTRPILTDVSVEPLPPVDHFAPGTPPVMHATPTGGVHGDGTCSMPMPGGEMRPAQIARDAGTNQEDVRLGLTSPEVLAHGGWTDAD